MRKGRLMIPDCSNSKEIPSVHRFVGRTGVSRRSDKIDFSRVCRFLTSYIACGYVLDSWFLRHFFFIFDFFQYSLDDVLCLCKNRNLFCLYLSVIETRIYFFLIVLLGLLIVRNPVDFPLAYILYS